MKEKIRLSKSRWIGATLGVAVALGSITANAEFAIIGDSNSELSYDGTNAVVKYTQSGSLKVIGSGTVDILLVGGGGGAGSGYPESVKSDGRGGAGGGAGGVIYRKEMTLLSGTYPIVVGAGGIGGGWTTDASATAPHGANGGDSSAFGLVAYGGGGGAGARSKNPGLAGGSGGGSCNPWTDPRVAGGKAVSGQGCDGGYSDKWSYPAGGGGAGEAGGVDNYDGGKGGDGLMFDITGKEVWYAGGGAGLRGESHIPAVQGGKGGGGAGTAGTDGLGGGGSGGCNGGSGVVIIRYKCRPQGLIIIAR